MPQTKHNVTLDDLYDILQEIKRRLITVEASIKPEPVFQQVQQPENTEFHRILEQTHGAWAAHPWTNHIADIRAMHEEWDEHEPDYTAQPVL
jgi:hypothetical protein